MKRGRVILSHGRGSSPQAAKVLALAEVAEAAGWATQAIDYRGLSKVEEWVAHLCRSLHQVDDRPLVLMGSSMGGVVSVLAAQQCSVDALFLLAPALYYPGYENSDLYVTVTDIEIVHAWPDAVVPYQGVVRWAQEQQANLHMVSDDHSLMQSLPMIENLMADFLERVAAA